MIFSGVMKCKTDYLEFIYNGKDEKICGKQTSIPPIHIPSNNVIIKFHSSNMRLERRGFLLTYVTKELAMKRAMDKNTGNLDFL